MNFRQSVLWVGCISLLAMIGLVVLFGLVIGGRAVVAYSQSTPTPTKTPRPPLTATHTPTPVVLMAATSWPADAPASSPAAASVAIGLSTATDTPTPVVLVAATSLATPTPSDMTAPSPTHTPIPADTPAGTPAPSPTPSPSPTGTLTPTPTLSTATRITGRLLLDGVPVSQGTRLKLENRSYQVVAETTVGADGVYAFTDLEASSEGYNVLFAQEWNSPYKTNQVVSWGWLGPVAVENGAVIELPDFDVSLLGFKQVNPEADATFSAAAISSQSPVVFEWTAYPQAAKYWVDLVCGEEQKLVWQSLGQATSLAFDGTLGNGAHIQPGEYWWGVGARRELGPYKLTVYGYLQGLIIEP